MFTGIGVTANIAASLTDVPQVLVTLQVYDPSSVSVTPAIFKIFAVAPATSLPFFCHW